MPPGSPLSAPIPASSRATSTPSFTSVIGWPAHRLVRRLIDAGLASERNIDGTSLKVTHVHGHALYRALHIPFVRHRRAARPFVFLRRLLCLDHVAEHLSLPWLPTEIDKLEYFLCRGCSPHELPQRTYAAALKGTRRYFHNERCRESTP